MLWLPERNEPERRACRQRGRACRSLALSTLGILLVPIGVGCGELAAISALIPSSEDLAAFEREMDAFGATVEALPSVTVRIVNGTDATARVTLVSGMAGPEPEGIFGIGQPAGNSLAEIDSQGVLISPFGSASGTVKCGEVIGISITAPLDGAYSYAEPGGFGLFVEPGNIQLSGAGVSQETFTGDVIGARFLNVAGDRLDCTADVLVIEIDALPIVASFDPVTGELIAEQTRGTGTLRIE